MRIGVLGPVAAWAGRADTAAEQAQPPSSTAAEQAQPSIGVGSSCDADPSDGGGPDVSPRGLRVRGLLARLALDAGRTVTTTALIDGLWGAESPDSAANAVQALVSRLRRALGAEYIATVPGGYRLEVARGDVDALRFAELLAASRAAPDPQAAADLAAAALALWRGPALADVRRLPFAAAEADLLTEQRAAAVEWSAAQALASGRPEPACDALAALLAEQPLRESAAAALARCLATVGRQADALAVLDRTRDRLAAELGVDPGAELQHVRLEVLRGELPAPPRNGRPHVVAAGAAVGPARHRTALTSFVGRDADVARVRAILASARLVTLVGPGGAGKTRLALEAAADTDIPGGRPVVVELAPLTGPDALAATVLAAVGTQEIVLRTQETPQDLTERLVTTVGDRPALLLLDNCEHLVDAVAELTAELLTRCPGLRVLATSREPLRVPGELLHPVEPLDEAAAVRLFVDRGRAVVPGFATDGDDEAVIAEICRRLDGQPLPIELAAARLRVLSPAEILDRLDDRFRLLTSGARTTLPRHQTLRAVVDWSWELLTDDERAVARRLSVFAGGATAEAAERVCAARQDGEVTTGPAPDAVFDLLAALVDKSLVVRVPGGAGTSTRYRMLETIREYATERLDASGERATVVAAHTEWVLELVERTEPELRGARQLVALRRLQTAADDVTAALRRAVTAGQVAPACRLAAGFFWFWMLRGRNTEATSWIRAVSDLLAEAGPDVAVPGQARALTLAYRALLEIGCGLPAHARARAEEAARFAAEVPPPRHPVLELVGPALAAFADGDTGPVERIAAGHPDPWTTAAALVLRAVLAENAGRPADQRRFARAAHDRFRRLGDRFGVGTTLVSLGDLESLSGDVEAAAGAYEEAIVLATELGNVDDLPQHQVRRGELAARHGRWAEAREWIDRAWATARDSPSPANEVLEMLAMAEADLARRRGDLARARTLLAREDAAAKGGLGVPQRQAYLAMCRGRVEIDAARSAEAERPAGTAAGHEAAARSHLAEAVEAAVVSNDGPVAASVAETVARLAATGGDLRTAARLLGVARTLRGMLDHGDPQVVAVVDAVRRAGAEPLLEQVAAQPRDVCLRLLREAVGAAVRSGAGTA